MKSTYQASDSDLGCESGSAFILPPGSGSMGVNFEEKTEKCKEISSFCIFILKNKVPVHMDQLHGF